MDGAARRASAHESAGDPGRADTSPPVPAPRPRDAATRAVLVGAVLLSLLALGAAVMTDPFSPRVEDGIVAETTPVAGPGSGVVGVSQLEAGQCFAAFESAWQPSFQIADCAVPHAAELYAIIPAAQEGAPFPGEEALAAEAMRACQSPELIDLAGSAAIEGLLIDASYPLSQAEWDAGNVSYLCFASRSGGVPLEGSLRPSG